MRLFFALAWLYRLLLFIAVPCIAVNVYGLPLSNVLMLLAMIFYIDTVAEACGWAIFREDEYELILGAYALYMFTSVYVLLSLLVMPSVPMVYLPIIALLGGLSLIGKHGVVNRKFDVVPMLYGSLLLLGVLTLFTIPLSALFASLIIPIILLLIINKKEDVPHRGILCAKLLVCILISLVVTVLSFFKVLNMTMAMGEKVANMLSSQYSENGLGQAFSTFLMTLLFAFPEEFIGRAFIPYVGAGLTNYVFVTLHIPKLAYATAVLVKYFGNVLTMAMMLSSGCWIATASIILTWVWRRSGLLGSALAHALTNTIIMLFASGAIPIALGLTITLTLLYYILSYAMPRRG